MCWHGLSCGAGSGSNCGAAGMRVLPVLRLHLFHLLQTVSPNSMDLDVGRSRPRAARRGLPRACLLGRAVRVPGPEPAAARAEPGAAALPVPPAARPRGKRPAMRATSVPCTRGSPAATAGRRAQLLHLNPLSGRWLPDTTYLQRHVGLAVAYNVWQYYQATGDREFLAQHGAEMILEIARFFASLAAYDRDRDRYVIRGVVGPDEFHTGYPDSPEAGHRQQRLHQRDGGLGAAPRARGRSSCSRPDRRDRAHREAAPVGDRGCSGGNTSPAACSCRSTRTA